MTATWPVRQGLLPEVAHELPAAARRPDPAATAAVSLDDVTACFRGRPRPSVSHLTLAIRPGQVFGLLGPNGSGKTTTINMVTGLVQPSGGTVRVFGRPPQQARRLMGVVTQETALYAQLSCQFNLKFAAWLYGYAGHEQRRRVSAALRLANLAGAARQRAGTLSGGMARRLAIARALLHDPQLIILDEPTLGVDPAERATLWEHIRALADSGRTVVLTTNIMEEADALCDQVAIMRDGQLAAQPASPASLQRRYGGTVITVQAAGASEAIRAAAAALLREPGIVSADVIPRSAGYCEVLVTSAAAGGAAGTVITALTGHGVAIMDLSARPPSLSEVFLRVTGAFPAAR
jgi:ABC-2 type transport system ATP-binding protein